MSPADNVLIVSFSRIGAVPRVQQVRDGREARLLLVEYFAGLESLRAGDKMRCYRPTPAVAIVDPHYLLVE